MHRRIVPIVRCDEGESALGDLPSCYLAQSSFLHATCCDSAGQEGFAGNSTPLYMYSNPGAWASLLGVDFVRNNKAKGIDYATMHVYVDQWLCVQEGSTTAGQLDFMKYAPLAHIMQGKHESM